MNKIKLNKATLKPNDCKKPLSQGHTENSTLSVFKELNIKLAIISLVVGVVSIILAIFFWISPLTSESKDMLEVTNISLDNANSKYSESYHANVDYSANKIAIKNSAHSVNSNNSSLNTTNNTVLLNSNNRVFNSSKYINKTVVKSDDLKSQGPVESFSDEQSVPSVKLMPKKVPLNSPEIYQEIRKKQISGSVFESIEILQRINYLTQLGLTLDYSNPAQGILKANEWIEVASLLAGQTDAWLSRHSVDNSDNRNYFDGMNGITNQAKEIDRVKSIVKIKIDALKTVSEVFTRAVKKIHDENKLRQVYNDSITQANSDSPK